MIFSPFSTCAFFEGLNSYKSSIIKPDSLDNKHLIYPFYIHKKKLFDIIKEHNLIYDDISNDEILETLSYIEKHHFQYTKQIINKLYQKEESGIITAYFSVISPNSRVKLHVNNDAYMHRAYLGIIVPEGDMAMKIDGQIIKWVEGDFIILDVTRPHCPHNFTNEYRVTLNIDFYRPEENREDMVELAKRQFARRMQDNPYGYGMYGTDDVVDKETLEKFGEYGEKMMPNPK